MAFNNFVFNWSAATIVEFRKITKGAGEIGRMVLWVMEVLMIMDVSLRKLGCDVAHFIRFRDEVAGWLCFRMGCTVSIGSIAMSLVMDKMQGVYFIRWMTNENNMCYWSRSAITDKRGMYGNEIWELGTVKTFSFCSKSDDKRPDLLYERSYEYLMIV